MNSKDLLTTTLELWPKTSKQILKEKGISVIKLKKYFKQVIFPWDRSYNFYRSFFSLVVEMRPLFINIPRNIDDLKKVICYIVTKKLTTRIVSGRHSAFLQNPDVFIIMQNFQKIKFNKIRGKLTVGAGVTQGMINDFLFKSFDEYHFPGAKINHPSLAFPGGSAASVSAIGITLAGGVGTLKRTIGLSIDSAISFKITIPPNHTIKVDSDHSPDLYWGLRGAGFGSIFGVVSEVSYKLPKIDKVISYSVSFDWSEAVITLQTWMETAPTRSNSFNEEIALHVDKEKNLVISVDGIYVIPRGQTIQEARNEIEMSLNNLNGKLVMNEAGNYSKIYSNIVKSRVYYNFSKGKTFFTKDSLNAEIIIERMEIARNFNSVTTFTLDLLGGVISDIPSDATAFYPRNANFFVTFFNFWNSDADSFKNELWNMITYETLYKYGDMTTYVGWPINNLKNPGINYFGENFPRILEIKEKYNYDNLLTSINLF